MSPLVECRELACGYPDRTVLCGISFSVSAGEAVAVLGPNGSGKSTLLKTLSKTLAPKHGEARLQGDSIARLSYREAARRAAFVPQDEPHAFPFRVRDVVAMGRLAHGDTLFESPEDLAVVEEALARADCQDLADRPVTELSGGERQRVLIARALAQQAPVLLLDEPSAHLDVGHQVGLVRTLRRLAGEGTAILVALHDLNLAGQIAERAILLHKFQIGLDAPMAKVLSSPLLDEVYGVRFAREGNRVWAADL